MLQRCLALIFLCLSLTTLQSMINPADACDASAVSVNPVAAIALLEDSFYGKLCDACGDANRHAKFELCKFPQTPSRLHAIVVALNGLAKQSLKNGLPEKLTYFDLRKIPDISLEDYLLRIVQSSQCSESCYIFALIYIDRYIQAQAGNRVSPTNIHQLFATALLIATKFLEDEFFDNAYYAKIFGISTAGLNRLEFELLFAIKFSLSVDEGTYNIYLTSLDKYLYRKSEGLHSDG